MKADNLGIKKSLWEIPVSQPQCLSGIRFLDPDTTGMAVEYTMQQFDVDFPHRLEGKIIGFKDKSNKP